MDYINSGCLNNDAVSGILRSGFNRGYQMSKKILSVLILVVFSTISHANSGYSIIPIHMNSGLASAVVKINGYKTHLVIDLGSRGNALLSQNIVNKSHATYVGKGRSSTSSNTYDGTYSKEKSKQIESTSYLVNNFIIGNYRLRNIEVVTVPGASFFGTENGKKSSSALDNGTIGIEIFKQFSVIFDYPHRKIVLIKNDIIPNSYNIQNWKKIHFDYDSGGGILLNVIANNIHLRVDLDSGSSTSTVTPQIASKIGRTRQCPKIIDSDARCKLLTVKDLIVGENHFGSVDFIVLGGKPQKKKAH